MGEEPHLLQGLLVCKGCGYACYGVTVTHRTTQGRAIYAYYRCRGSEASRFGGQRLCRTKQVRTDRLDAAVWEDVSSLLSEPDRVRAEYQRRVEGPRADEAREVGQLSKLINQVKKSISRLIDAYGDGLLDKSEFEPRIMAARERLSKLEEEQKRRTDEETHGGGIEAGDRSTGGVRAAGLRRVTGLGLADAPGDYSGVGQEGGDRRAGGSDRVPGQSIPF